MPELEIPPSSDEATPRAILSGGDRVGVVNGRNDHQFQPGRINEVHSVLFAFDTRRRRRKCELLSNDLSVAVAG
jgi:hypothetical protein